RLLLQTRYLICSHPGNHSIPFTSRTGFFHPDQEHFPKVIATLIRWSYHALFMLLLLFSNLRSVAVIFHGASKMIYGSITKIVIRFNFYLKQILIQKPVFQRAGYMEMYRKMNLFMFN